MAQQISMRTHQLYSLRYITFGQRTDDLDGCLLPIACWDVLKDVTYRCRSAARFGWGSRLEDGPDEVGSLCTPGHGIVCSG